MAKKIALAVAATVLTLALAEGALRLVGYGRVTPALAFGENTRRAVAAGRFLPDRHLFWKLSPVKEADLDRRLHAVHPDLPFPAHGARPRILVLGDSCSRLALDGLPWPAGLQARLGEDAAEVVTAAVPGYSSYQGRVWLRRQLLDLRPDVVLVYFGWNDHWRSTGLADTELARQLAARRLRLATLVERLLRRGRRPLRVPPADYAANLRAMVDAVRARGGRVALVAAPHRLDAPARRHLVQTGYLLPADDAVRLHQAYLDTLRAVARAAHVPVLPADTVFARLRGERTLLHRDGIHPNRSGHAVLVALAADAVARLLPAAGLPDTVRGDDPLSLARRALAGGAAAPAGPSAGGWRR